MANYPKYNLTGKLPAFTYQNIVQYNVESASFVDSLGNDLPPINITASVSETASFAISASWAPSAEGTVESASWASQSLSASSAGAPFVAGINTRDFYSSGVFYDSIDALIGFNNTVKGDYGGKFIGIGSGNPAGIKAITELWSDSDGVNSAYNGIRMSALNGGTNGNVSLNCDLNNVGIYLSQNGQQVFTVQNNTVTVTGEIQSYQSDLTLRSWTGFNPKNVVLIGTLNSSGDLIVSSNLVTIPVALAQGGATLVSGSSSHAEGSGSIASGSFSHAEGHRAVALGEYSHAEGEFTVAGAKSWLMTAVSASTLSHPSNQMYQQFPGGFYSIVGNGMVWNARKVESSNLDNTDTFSVVNFLNVDFTIDPGIGNQIWVISVQNPENGDTGSLLTVGHAEGIGTKALGQDSHAEGSNAQAFGVNSHAEGLGTIAAGPNSHAEGGYSLATGDGAHAEGGSSMGGGGIASGEGSHAEGNGATASGSFSHAEGDSSVIAYGGMSHAEGSATTTTGFSSHAEGYRTLASGNYSHAEGMGEATQNIASGNGSHVEGLNTTASALYGHAEGIYCSVNGDNSSIWNGGGGHAEGERTVTNARGAHAEGANTFANGGWSHAEGNSTITVGAYSHAGGLGTIASGSNQTVIGNYNERGNDVSLFVVGNGGADVDTARSDAFRIDSNATRIIDGFNPTLEFIDTHAGDFPNPSAGTINFKCNEWTASTGIAGARTVVSLHAERDPIAPDGGVSGQFIVNIEEGSGGSSEYVRISGRQSTIYLSGSIINGPNANTGLSGFTGSLFGTASQAVSASWAPIPITYPLVTLPFNVPTHSIDFSAGQYFQLTQVNQTDIYFSSSVGLAAVRNASVYIVPQAGARTVTFNPNWVVLGNFPTTISSSKAAVVSLTSFGTDDSGVIVAFGSQL